MVSTFNHLLGSAVVSASPVVAVDVGVEVVASDAGVEVVASDEGVAAVAVDEGVEVVAADDGVAAVAADEGVEVVAILLALYVSIAEGEMSSRPISFSRVLLNSLETSYTQMYMQH